jgi:hypothetical protein
MEEWIAGLEKSQKTNKLQKSKKQINTKKGVELLPRLFFLKLKFI